MSFMHSILLLLIGMALVVVGLIVTVIGAWLFPMV